MSDVEKRANKPLHIEVIGPSGVMAVTWTPDESVEWIDPDDLRAAMNAISFAVVGRQ